MHYEEAIQTYGSDLDWRQFLALFFGKNQPRRRMRLIYDVKSGKTDMKIRQYTLFRRRGHLLSWNRVSHSISNSHTGEEDSLAKGFCKSLLNAVSKQTGSDVFFRLFQ
jgi:hypothetical protein